MKINSGINYIETIANTNSFMLDYPDKLADGTALYTLHQTMGKGRRGRSWQEKNGNNMALSIAYSIDISKIAPLPLIAGLSVLEAVKDLSGISLQLKWSNDIVLKGKKIGGILCESRTKGDKTRVVIGIGINLIGSAESFAKKELPYAQSLKEILGKELNSAELVETIKHHLDSNIKEYITLGFSNMKEIYVNNCITLGKEIIIEEKGIIKQEKAVGIHDDGALICLSKGEKSLIYGGEVSVRGLYGYI